jgi:alpha-galactosidase
MMPVTMMHSHKSFLLIGALLIFVVAGCRAVGARDAAPATSAAGGDIRIEFNDQMHSRIVSLVGDRETILGPYAPSEYVSVNGSYLRDFVIDSEETEAISDRIGAGTKTTISGVAEGLRKTVEISFYDEHPSMAVFQVSYLNEGDGEITIDRWANNHYRFSAEGRREHPFWSYQSESTSSRNDWVFPVSSGFEQENFMGMNNSDYGGGTPISNLWRPDVGLAVGHVDMVPRLVSIPVRMSGQREAELAVAYEAGATLAPGQSLETFRTFANVHTGDYFATLVAYRQFMVGQGIEFPEIHDDSYAPQWCAWGYEREFTMDQVYGALPMVRELGYRWVVLDDGWQTNVGDWELHADKYPRGAADMRAFVDRVHDEGFRSKLWWAPLAVHSDANIYTSNPDYLLLDENQEPVHITWWNANYMCPAYRPVQQFHNDLVTTFMRDWGYEGLKIDGQHLNAAPPCYNPAHNHERPEESVEAMADFFAGIHRTATSITPDALVEICPCGTAYAFHNMPFMTQGVASDPTSSWQVRHKGKTLKGLMGESTPYFGDHVELSDNGTDFASSQGIGAVIGTKFTWPVGSGPDPETDLTPEREQEWAKWASLYRERELPRGIYMGSLYDIGFDRPEAHAISRNDRMYYAFYADQRPGRDHDDVVSFNGPIELRGLDAGRTYLVRDYVNDRELGQFQGPLARFDVRFDGHLLLEAIPQ